MLKKQQRIAVVMALLTSACMGDTAREIEDIPLQNDLRARLHAGMLFDFAPAENNFAEIQATLLRSNVSEAIKIAIEAGTLEFSAGADDSLQVDVLTIALGDVFVPASVFPPAGIELTDIFLELRDKTRQAIDLSWTQDGHLGQGRFDADLVLHWSVVRDDHAIGLADVVITSAPVHMTIDDLNAAAMPPNRTHVTLSIEKDGAFWRWADTFEFRDLGLDDLGGRSR